MEAASLLYEGIFLRTKRALFLGKMAVFSFCMTLGSLINFKKMSRIEKSIYCFSRIKNITSIGLFYNNLSVSMD